jgi:hypothetical protein
MGGPSRAAYREAEKRRRARRDALRTRGGVVDLTEWRAALRTVAAVEGLLHEPPWLKSVQLAPAADVGCDLRVTMLWDSAEARMCLPASVDGVPVRVLVRNPGARPLHRVRE